MGKWDRRYLRVLAITSVLGVAALGLFSSTAEAAPDFVLGMPEDGAPSGSGAGALNFPKGIAANSDNGRVYVSDRNDRVSEYTAWGLFVKAWGWGVADGANELQTCSPPEPSESPDPALCRQGIEGDGRGQLADPAGLAVDSEGDVYVMDQGNLRVQKFSPTGQFILMFGAEVNRTKVEEGAPASEQDICPVVPSDVCQAGVAGLGSRSFSIFNALAYSPGTDLIVVGGEDRIQMFSPSGTHSGEIPFQGPLAAFDGKLVIGLDVDSTGNIYIVLNGTEDVYKVSEGGAPLAPGHPGQSSFKVERPFAVAVSDEGHVYVVDRDFGLRPSRVFEFSESGAQLMPDQGELLTEEFFPFIPFNGPVVEPIATNTCPGSGSPGSLYVGFSRSGQLSYVNAYGSGPIGCEDPPQREPAITAQFASSVGRDEATVKAQINPHFWPDTNYYVEYGTSVCSEGGCGLKQPIPPGELLTRRSVNADIITKGILLGGLQAGTTYRYRFVAQSSGGGPVTGEERTFRTSSSPSGAVSCSATGAFRIGPSAQLPDCRAYELVSPLDKGNGDAASWTARAGLVPMFFELHQSAPSGERFTFSSLSPFSKPQSAPFISQYLAGRTGEGWSTQSLVPPRTVAPVLATNGLSNEFQAFSSDLCRAWVRHYSIAPLASEAIPGYTNLYRRENCTEPQSYVPLTTAPPANRGPGDYFELRQLGASADGSHSAFVVNGELLSDVPNLENKEFQLSLYEHTPEGLRFVCYLPNGNSINTACSAGTAIGNATGKRSSVRNAVSADGSKIFWTAYNSTFSTPDQIGYGQIYLRLDSSQTVNVSRSVPGSGANDAALYWTAADDGSKAIFEFFNGALKDELYEFDVSSQTPKRIAGEVLGPMSASEDASHIYFASTEDLADGATAGGRNLYAYEAGENGDEGTFTFIMELAAGDIGGSDVTPRTIDDVPTQRAARATPDGRHVAFVSSVTREGYDNLDAVTGKPDQEVYLYDVEDGELLCVSCNPTGARPVGEGGEAARLQGWEVPLHAPRVITDDGRRVYFESHEALVPRDTNGAWDVYQWEEAGMGSCTTTLSTFSEPAQGCIDLISAGKSPLDSTFLDADPQGEDVFIGTMSSLVGIDYGLSDVYDARIGGGFPEPVTRPECEGEACQSPPPPPPDVTPASATFVGPGNPKTTKKKARSCKKAKKGKARKAKKRCAKKQKHSNGKGDGKGAGR